jgi:glutathione synthase/RimK-type ligase-like ATP-grasp enzyme
LSATAPGAAGRPGGRQARLAAASSARLPDLHDDWPLLRAALDDHGVDAVTAVWNDPGVDWSAFDLVLASGAWDNIHHVDEFLAWADAVAASGVPVRNAPATLRWNIDKRYLRDLERAGVPTVPTVWLEPAPGGRPGAPPALPEGEVVVKPSVSGGGYRTARYEPHERAGALAHVDELLASGRTAMVQPYEGRVDTEGETGLVYVGGRFSHAVHKDPMIRRGVGPADSLIENQVVTGATATAAQLAVAGRALAAAEALVGPSTYARVDLVPTRRGEPALLELELLDPVLFFPLHPEGARALARLLAGALADRRPG